MERLQARLVEQAEKYEHYRAYIGEPPMNGNFISEAYWFIKKEVPVLIQAARERNQYREALERIDSLTYSGHSSVNDSRFGQALGIAQDALQPEKS